MIACCSRSTSAVAKSNNATIYFWISMQKSMGFASVN